LVLSTTNSRAGKDVQMPFMCCFTTWEAGLELQVQDLLTNKAAGAL